VFTGRLCRCRAAVTASIDAFNNKIIATFTYNVQSPTYVTGTRAAATVPSANTSRFTNAYWTAPTAVASQWAIHVGSYRGISSAFIAGFRFVVHTFVLFLFLSCGWTASRAIWFGCTRAIRTRRRVLVAAPVPATAQVGATTLRSGVTFIPIP
jgi:hypothetical protein